MKAVSEIERARARAAELFTMLELIRGELANPRTSIARAALLVALVDGLWFVFRRGLTESERARVARNGAAS